jgi:tetratricopeptide (TPR) repeat protein
MEVARTNSISELFFWAASEFMEERLFSEAADKIVTIIKAFEFESSFYKSFTEKMDGLDYEGFDEFISELIRRIAISKNLAEYFNKPEQLEALSHFSFLLADHLKKKAVVYDEKSKPEVVIKYLKKALELNPDNYDILSNLGRLYFRIGEFDNAKELLERVNNLRPNDPIVLNNLGGAYLLKKDYMKAEEVLRKAVELEPENPIYLHNFGRSLVENKKYSDAERFLEKANELQPNDFLILHELGTLYVKIFKYGDAEIVLKMADQLKSGHRGILQQLGRVYLGKGEYSKAMEILEEVSKLAPHDHIGVLVDLSMAYIGVGKYDNAEELLKKVDAASPKNSHVLNHFGILFRYRKQLDKSIEYFIEAALLKPEKDRGDIYNNIALLYWEKGEVSKAHQFIKYALDLAPSYNWIVRKNYDMIMGKGERVILFLH